jgi:hypothetical protein
MLGLIFIFAGTLMILFPDSYKEATILSRTFWVLGGNCYVLGTFAGNAVVNKGI